MLSEQEKSSGQAWTITGPSFSRPGILQFIYKDFLKTGMIFHSLTWWVLLFPTPKSYHLQQQVGITPCTAVASPAALQAGMLSCVLHHGLSQLWAGMGQRSGDRLLVKPTGCQPPITFLCQGHCALPHSQGSPAAFWSSGMLLPYSPVMTLQS